MSGDQNAAPEDFEALKGYADLGEEFWKTMMCFRGLQLHEAPKFDFDVPSEYKRWPGPEYGPNSPHHQDKRLCSSKRAERSTRHALFVRSAKSRPKPANTHQVGEADPIRSYGAPPLRDQPLHLLNLPGELRDMIYELLALSKEPIYAQPRPGFRQFGPGMRSRRVIRQYPQEPNLALVNRQLRNEVLSLFYGANRFIIRRSDRKTMQRLNITNPMAILAWNSTISCSNYLQHVELHFDARDAEGDVRLIIYELKRLRDGQISITHDLGTAEICQCLENESVSDVLRLLQQHDLEHARHPGQASKEKAPPEAKNLVTIAKQLVMKRQIKLCGFAKRDYDEEGMFRMPTAACLYCKRPNLTHVSGG